MGEQIMPPALAAAFAELSANLAARQARNAKLSLPTPAANSVTVYPPTPGGPFTTIQAAINSISGQGPQNEYSVVAGPGTYNESITLISWITVHGSGAGQTILSGSVTAASNSALQSMTILPVSTPYAVSVIAATNFEIVSCAIETVTVGEALLNGVMVDGRKGPASAALDNLTVSLNAKSPAANYPMGIGAIGQATVVMSTGSVTTQMANHQDTGVQAGGAAAISLKYLTVTSSNLALETDAKSNIYVSGCTIVGKTSGNIHVT
jgi:hypothetical protein